MLEVSRTGLAAPLYSTPRTRGLATFGPYIDATAAHLGHPAMPWQSHVGHVASEVLEDGSPRWPTVVISTPRQSGKTTFLESFLSQKCMTLQDYRAWYTAQTGQDANDVWHEWHRNLAMRLPGLWTFRESNGSMRAEHPRTGSFIRPFPPKPDALHGKQSDFAGLDEVWALTLTDGAAITQAVVPTQATRSRGQLFIVSTAGDESSVWLRGWIERGRAAALDPENSTIAYFEWATPEGYAIDDPATWAAFHPAYGHTITERAMRNALDQMGEEQFRRAYCNQWPQTETSWRAGWAALASTERIPDRARVFLAMDAQLDHRSGAFTAAGKLEGDANRIAVEVIEHRPGVGWMLDRARELTRKHKAPVGILRTGPIGYMIPELKGAGVPVLELSQGDNADAAGKLRTLITTGLIVHPDDPRLNKAVETVDLRASGDRDIWKRRDPSVDVCPLVAAALSVWQAARPALKPRVIGLSADD